jgi:hypothetical protein
MKHLKELRREEIRKNQEANRIEANLHEQDTKSKSQVVTKDQLDKIQSMQQNMIEMFQKVTEPVHSHFMYQKPSIYPVFNPSKESFVKHPSAPPSEMTYENETKGSF